MVIEGGRVLAVEDDIDLVVSQSLSRTMIKRLRNNTEEKAREESRVKIQPFRPS